MPEPDQRRGRAHWGVAMNEDKRPYAVLGAGALVSSLHKRRRGLDRWSYRFNIYRQASTGAVTQLFQPDDVMDLVKLSQVLAFSIAEDGCLDPNVRRRLFWIAEELDAITHQAAQGRADV